MSNTPNHRARLFLTSILLVGPFSFVQTLLFRPKMLTAYMSGDELFVPMETQILFTTLVMIASAFLGAIIIHRKGRPNIVLTVATCSLLPLVCVFTLLTFKIPLTPPVVSSLLGISCILQIQLTIAKRPLIASSSFEDFAWSAVIVLCVSSLLSHMFYTFGVSDYHATICLAFLMFITGSIISFVRQDGQSEVHWKPSLGEIRNERIRLLLRSAAAVVAAGIICSLSLGLSWNNDAFQYVLRDPVLFVIGAATALLVLLVLKRFWHNRPGEGDRGIAYYMVVPISMGLLSSLLVGMLGLSITFVLLVTSNLLFLALLWIEMLYLSNKRILFATSVPSLLLALLLAVFAFGIIISSVIPNSIAIVTIPILALAYLVFLFIYIARLSGSRQKEAASRPSFDEIRKAACEQMKADFNLSDKESEVLYYLVTGLSSPAIGKKLFISHETVKTHKYHIYQKMGIGSFEEAAERYRQYADDVCTGDNIGDPE